MGWRKEIDEDSIDDGGADASPWEPVDWGEWTDVSDGHDNCDNYDWSTDSTGDSCSSWYDLFPGTCGDFDTADFSANYQCCACGGGHDVQPLNLAKDKPAALSLKASTKPMNLAATKALSLQNGRKTGHMNLSEWQCRNTDAGIFDITGDNCKSWYDSYADSACTGPLFKDDDFDAEVNCCACGGGEWTDVSDGHDNCDNYDWSTDSTGDSCSSWYDLFPGTCGDFDTADFSANYQCCACGGGYNVQPLNLKADVKLMNLADRKALILANASGEGQCFSTDGSSTGDLTGDSCAWYAEYPDSCGFFDDDDFAANTMCCACGGGNRQAVDGYPWCDNTNFDFTDTTGDDCAWYDSFPETCGGFDTADFKSNDMCCACGGGYEMQCEDTSLGFTDRGGDNCAWYADRRDQCGNFDDEDFRANEMCCTCGGGSIPSTCTNDNPTGAGDTAGDRCAWYDSNPSSCGAYDDEDFRANDFCCGGGITDRVWPPAATLLKGVTKQNNDASYTDCAIAVFSALATLAVAGWSIKTGMTKRIQARANNDVFERLM